MLAPNPIYMGGNSVSIHIATSHATIPTVMLATHPAVEARFQYNPPINGTNRETKLKAELSPTNSQILPRNDAIAADAKATPTTEIRRIFNCAASESSPHKGLIRFSPTTVAGARTAPLAVLKMAEINAPKKAMLCLQD